MGHSLTDYDSEINDLFYYTEGFHGGGKFNSKYKGLFASWTEKEIFELRGLLFRR